MDAEKNTTFHPFKRLPLELRYMIYAFMIPDRRIIEIQKRRHTYESTEGNEFSVFYDLPAVCYISGEARDWASNVLNYKPAFGANLNGHEIYYNPQRDSLLFDDLGIFEKFFNTDFGRGTHIQYRTGAIDASKAIEAPLFLAINHAWQMRVTKSSFRLLGQPKNLVLARRSSGPGFMDIFAKADIKEALQARVTGAEGDDAEDAIVPPEMIKVWTFKELRDAIEKLNRPPPPVPGIEHTAEN